jgi:hypothetical protein
LAGLAESVASAEGINTHQAALIQTEFLHVRNALMRVNEPKKRLNNFAVGDKIKLKGHEFPRPFTIGAIREDGYFELYNDKGRLVVTAAGCHEVEEYNNG